MADADGSIILPLKIIDEDAKKKLDHLMQKIEKMKTQLSKSTETKSGIEKELEAAKLKADETRKSIDALKNLLSDNQRIANGEYEIATGKTLSSAERLAAQEAALELTNQIEQQEAILKEQKEEVSKLNRDYNRITRTVENQTRALDEAKTKAGELQNNLYKSSGAMAKFGKRLTNLANRVFVFSVITSALRNLRTWLSNVIEANSEASKALAQLKGALLTLAQPLVDVLIPAFTFFVNLLTRVVNVLAQVTSFIFGTTAEQSSKAAKALYDQQEALDGVGSSASEAKKQLMGFDELNTLSEDSSDGGSGSSSGSSVDFTTPVVSTLFSIAELFTGIALMALGAVIAFSGANIPLGIGMMIAGAAMVYDAVTENWSTIVEKLQGIPSLIMGIAGLVLVIGALLAFSGGAIPLGIGLMIAGAGLLGTAAAVNWDTIVTALQGPIGDITKILSGALLAVGACLALSGTNIPLGIGLMAIGAAGLAAVVYANWDTIVTALQGPIGVITGVVSAALLVLGAVLLFSGVNVPLGLALLAAGGVGLAMVVAANWDFIVEKVRDIWNAVKEFWNAYIAPVFTASWWGNLAKNMFNGFISTIESGINGVLSGIASFINSIINMIGSIPGVNISGSLSWGNVHLPRLASGAVIPANREFLAVLGDQTHGNNIEAPEDLIRKIVREEAGGSDNSEVVALLQELVSAVYGIQVGDEVIGRAAMRYERRNARASGV